MRKSLRFRQVGAAVDVIVDGRLVASLPWQAALDSARALQGVARLAETHAKVEQVVDDHALLIRAGVPIGLSHTPRMIDEAAKRAAWDRDLRRYLPGGVKSREAFGTPAIRTHQPRTAA